jgi:hypothetical protein
MSRTNRAVALARMPRSIRNQRHPQPNLAISSPSIVARPSACHPASRAASSTQVPEECSEGSMPHKSLGRGAARFTISLIFSLNSFPIRPWCLSHREFLVPNRCGFHQTGPTSDPFTPSDRHTLSVTLHFFQRGAS